MRGNHLKTEMDSENLKTHLRNDRFLEFFFFFKLPVVFQK